MAARPAPFKQVELTRIAKAMQAAGIKSWRFIVRPDGTTELVTGDMDTAKLGPDPDELFR
ncbi:hypothetical protein ORIO_03770 [Cereibacter azotoformans]|uniref:hypothetical protein n=1 Tax=Cereibacter azotoformans TaxID=43057 RepID=UPI0005C7796C|nr:hypothetical protein [Cereibacter azotoformans]ULB09049.1 hypothetical protein ORIO_03770 [Cereibacter azotoformans]